MALCKRAACTVANQEFIVKESRLLGRLAKDLAKRQKRLAVLEAKLQHWQERSTNAVFKLNESGYDVAWIAVQLRKRQIANLESCQRKLAFWGGKRWQQQQVIQRIQGRIDACVNNIKRGYPLTTPLADVARHVARHNDNGDAIELTG